MANRAPVISTRAREGQTTALPGLKIRKDSLLEANSRNKIPSLSNLIITRTVNSVSAVLATSQIEAALTKDLSVTSKIQTKVIKLTLRLPETRSATILSF